jgi:hypothetical protein
VFVVPLLSHAASLLLGGVCHCAFKERKRRNIYTPSTPNLILIPVGIF